MQSGQIQFNFKCLVHANANVNANSIMDCNNNQPGERIGHIAACYQGFMLIWGGYQGYNVSEL